ncbi:MAG: hypothetical protein R6V62_02535 [Candidatus Fermentibacteraceae bacterium]
MVKTSLPFILSALLFSGCFLEGGLGPGKTAEVEITAADPGLEEVLADAEAVLLEAGIPVENDFPCVELKLKSGGITVVEATASGRFDPVMAVVDKDGAVLAVNDDWDGEVDSRIVLGEVPSGARILVWGLNGDRGRVTVAVSEGTAGDLEEWTIGATLATGLMESFLLEDKGNDCMEELVDDLDDSEIYVSDWESAILVPFSVTTEGYYSIALDSDEFDPYMVVVSFDRGRADYLAMNDDSGMDWNSRLMLNLEPGSYGVLVNSYSGSEDSPFSLSVSPVELGDGEISWVEVPGSGEGVISGEEMAMVFWPGINDEWHCSGIVASTPVSAFGFVVEESGLYELSAVSDIDCTLTLLGYESPEDAYCMDYNDDYDGWNPTLILNLEPGTYLAIVAPYDDASQAAVTFLVESGEENLPEPVPLALGAVHELTLDPGVPIGLFTLNMVGGYNYSISAESEDLDAMIIVTFADGSQLVDDDGGEGFNSYIEFVPTAGQLGEALLRVETYAGTPDGTITVSFQRLERLSEEQSFSLYD